MSTDDEQRRIDELRATAAQLIEGVNALNRESGDALVGLAKGNRSNRRAIIALVISLLLDVALTLVIGGLWSAAESNTERLNSLTTRLDYSQTVQRQKVLCPLYTLLLGQVDAARAAAATMTPEQQQRQEETIKVIQAGYDSLKCSDITLQPPQ